MNTIIGETISFGKELSEFRTKYDLSQNECADILGISKNYVSAIERGRSASAALIEKFNQIRTNFAKLPDEWVKCKDVFDVKPSQGILNTNVNYSTRVEFIMQLHPEKPSYTSVKNGYYTIDDDFSELFVPIVDLSAYEKYRIKEDEDVYRFFDSNVLWQLIMDNTLVITKVQFELNRIHVHVAPLSIPIHRSNFRIVLRKLEREESVLAEDLIRSRYSEWNKKKTWDWDMSKDRSLTKQVANGLKTGIFNGYAFILETLLPSGISSKCISYADVKMRIDGFAELGAIATDISFVGNKLAKTLIWLLRLKHFNNPFWVGTSLNNNSMLLTLAQQSVSDKKHFVPYKFMDSTGRSSHQVRERTGEGDAEISVYLACHSLSYLLYENLMESTKEATNGNKKRSNKNDFEERFWK